MRAMEAGKANKWWCLKTMWFAYFTHSTEEKQCGSSSGSRRIQHMVCVWREEETAAFLELLHEIKRGQEGNATQYQELPPFLHLLLFQWYNNDDNNNTNNNQEEELRFLQLISNSKYWHRMKKHTTLDMLTELLRIHSYICNIFQWKTWLMLKPVRTDRSTGVNRKGRPFSRVKLQRLAEGWYRLFCAHTNKGSKLSKQSH